MTLAKQQVLKRYPLTLDTQVLHQALADMEWRIHTYDQIIQRFEQEHGCSLEIFEKKMERREVPEHPSWETAIEWGVAMDERKKLGVISHQWKANDDVTKRRACICNTLTV